MRVLFLAAEVSPIAKVGGLADVAGELPRELRHNAIDIRICLPFHSSIDRRQLSPVEIAKVVVVRRNETLRATVYETMLGNLPVWLVDGAPVQAVPGIYADASLDAEKYVFSSLAALEMCVEIDWMPDIVHANDWQFAAAVMKLAQLRATQPGWRETRSLFTIHNLAYMGSGAEAALSDYGLRCEASVELPPWAKSLPLPQAILQADWISTVSPTYAREILTPELGNGLEQLLDKRGDRLSGILNGIAPELWDPASDDAISQTFDTESLPHRTHNKSALQSHFGLGIGSVIPLFGIVSRLDYQKGLELIWPAFNALGSQSWQLIILGTGDPAIEADARVFTEEHPLCVRFIPEFNDALARQLYAGCDMLLIPSRYEPCGLTQMIAMRYGCLPVVRSTGGLSDTVVDVDASDQGTGFCFSQANSTDLMLAMQRALTFYTHPEQWRDVQQHAMTRDNSWKRPALEYLALYQHIGALDAVRIS